MAHPTGNEYIRFKHWAAGWLNLLGILLGALVIVWANLAAIVAARWPAPGFFGWLATPFRFGEMGTVLRILFNLHAATDGGLVNLKFGSHPVVPADHVWWQSWWRYAGQHMLGVGIHIGRTAPIAWALSLDIAIGIAVWLPFVLWVGRLSKSVDPARRPGTSLWASRKELGQFVDAARHHGALPVGVVAPGLPGAGRPIAIPFHHRSGHIEVLGVTGSGKTACLFKPWIIHDSQLNDPSRPGLAVSTLVIDIKHPDLYDAVAPFIGSTSRPLMVLAPDHAETSMHYNPLEALDPSDTSEYLNEIQALTYSIVENTVMAVRDVPFHRGIETDMLEKMIQFAYEADPVLTKRQVEDVLRPHIEPGQKIPRVRSLPFLTFLTQLPREAFFEFISHVETDPQIPEKWKARFAQDMDRSKADFANTMKGLRRRLAAFMTPNVSRVTQNSNFRLDLLAHRPSTLIVGAPSGGEATQTFSALLLTQVIQHFLRVANAQPDRRLPVPVMIYLDEVINQARVPGLEDYVATLRELGCWFVVGLQDYSGLEQRYSHEGAQKLVNNLRTKIVLGTDINPVQAERSVIPLLGETTIVTHAQSSGDGGGRESMNVQRRFLKTVDQVRSMKLGEALVFLQGGLKTETRLPAMPRRDLATGSWHKDSLPGGPFGGLCAPLIKRFSKLPQDLRLTAAFRIAQRETGFADIVLLLSRLHHLGALSKRAESASAAAPAGAPAGPPVLTGAPTPDAVDPLVALHEAAKAAQASQGRQETPAQDATPSADATASQASPEPTGPQAPARDTPPQTIPQDDDSVSEEHAGEPAVSNGDAPPKAETVKSSPPEPDAIMDEIRGLYNAILVKQNLPTNGVWRITGDPALSLAFRIDVLGAYAARRATPLEKMLATWEQGGFSRGRFQMLNGGKAATSVVVLTAKAVSADRITPVLKDKMAAWPETPSALLRSAPAKSRPAYASRPAPGPTHQEPLFATQDAPERSDDPEVVLKGVIRWARQHEAELRVPGSEVIGRWETTVNDRPAFLIRSGEAQGLLPRLARNYQDILKQWKESRVILVSSAPADERENRYTIKMRVDSDDGTHWRRYLAFDWQALEKVGLQRETAA